VIFEGNSAELRLRRAFFMRAGSELQRNGVQKIFEDLNGRRRARLRDVEGSRLRCAKRSLGVLAE
jgi:hypothetical protein